MSRRHVEEFLKNRLEFTTKDLIDYLVKKGYSPQTAYAWITKLKHEGYIYVSRVNRNVRIYRSKLFEEEHEVPPYVVP